MTPPDKAEYDYYEYIADVDTFGYPDEPEESKEVEE